MLALGASSDKTDATDLSFALGPKLSAQRKPDPVVPIKMCAAAREAFCQAYEGEKYFEVLRTGPYDYT